MIFYHRIGKTMLDNMFPFMEFGDEDLFGFIAQVEDFFENPHQFKDSVKHDFEGSPYELHLILQSLKNGDIDFKEFMERASAWSKVINN